MTQTASINVGARLVAFDENDIITRIEDAGRTMMKQLGHKVALGEKITNKQKEDFGAYMAKILFEIIEQGPTSQMAKHLMVTPPFTLAPTLIRKRGQLDSIRLNPGQCRRTTRWARAALAWRLRAKG